MKYCILVGIEKYPIEEADIKKITQAMLDNSVVALKSGIFSGKAISGIVRDIHTERGWNYNYKPQGNDDITSGDFKTNLPEILSDEIQDQKLLD